MIARSTICHGQDLCKTLEPTANETIWIRMLIHPDGPIVWPDRFFLSINQGYKLTEYDLGKYSSQRTGLLSVLCTQIEGKA